MNKHCNKTLLYLIFASLENTMKFSLATKFNLVFITIFSIGFAASSVMTNYLLQDNAREESLHSARLLLQSASATRLYTTNRILPILQTRLEDEFLPQSVPSYAATEHLNQLLKSYPDFTYKEATLNPTNPRDRASDWEADLVSTFRAQPTLTELVGDRISASGPALYIAKPLQIKDAACLRCHSTPDAAPQSMRNIYGISNGFGWKHMEIVGAQVVSVPMDVSLRRANKILHTYMLSMLGIFLFLFVALNLMVHFFVTRRITQMSRLADKVSMGEFEDEKLNVQGNDELSTLAQSFSRMQTSLASAIKMLEK